MVSSTPRLPHKKAEDRHRVQETEKRPSLFFDHGFGQLGQTGSSEILTKFVNLVMRHGKKSLAFTLLIQALEESRQELAHQRGESHFSPLDFLESAIRNIEPSFEIRNKKIAGMTRHIPAVLSKKRGESLAIRWLLESAQKRRKTIKKGFSSALALELVEAYLQKGQPRQRRDALHKAAESNRAFLRYRWW